MPIRWASSGEAGRIGRPARVISPLSAAWTPVSTLIKVDLPAPFYAMPICSAITNTMGGIVVDGEGRVLDTQGAPIPGLFAAGSTVGGLDGGPRSGYVGGLIKAVMGLIAAETIASPKT